MKSFITGSHAYGTPRPDSDIDLVVLADHETKQFLTDHSEAKDSIRFGKLNVIVCTKMDAFELWEAGTLELQDSPLRPISPEQAHAFFKNKRELVGMTDDYSTS